MTGNYFTDCHSFVITFGALKKYRDNHRVLFFGFINLFLENDHIIFIKISYRAWIQSRSRRGSRKNVFTTLLIDYNAS